MMTTTIDAPTKLPHFFCSRETLLIVYLVIPPEEVGFEASRKFYSPYIE